MAAKKNIIYKIYKICCNDCNATNIGQTCRKLKIRISEHKNHTHKNTSTLSVIPKHKLQYDYDFNWEEVAILNTERNYNKRLISEIIYIKK